MAESTKSTARDLVAIKLSQTKESGTQYLDSYTSNTVNGPRWCGEQTTKGKTACTTVQHTKQARKIIFFNGLKPDYIADTKIS